MIGFRVMAVRQRAKWAEQLAEQLRCGITWDTERNVWHTGRRALMDAAEAGHEWVCVVQDDVILTRWFTPKILSEALSHVEGRPVGWYTGEAARTRHPMLVVGHELAEESGAGWVQYTGPVWGPAITIPTADVEWVVQAGDRNAAKGYDTKIQNAYKRRGVDAWYASPSLLDHRPVSENPSMFSNRTGDRRVLAMGEPRDWGKVQQVSKADLYPWVTVGDGKRSARVRRGTSKWKKLMQRKGWHEQAV